MDKSLLPREKALKWGIDKLDDSELLAILLNTGSKDMDVMKLSRALSEAFCPLSNLANVSFDELLNYKGIGNAKAIDILACIELGKRMFITQTKKKQLKSAFDIYEYCLPKVICLKQEILLALYLNNNYKVEFEKVITIGTVNSTLFDPRMVISWALKSSCYNIVIVHNHPSGDSNPSKEDNSITNKLWQSCNALGIVMLDHVIIGEGEYYSYALTKNFYIEQSTK